MTLRGTRLTGDLVIPSQAKGVVLFAYARGSNRWSACFVASALQRAGIGTLTFDLLTEDEQRADAGDGHLRFDVPLLARRLVAATDWVASTAALSRLPVGYLGASTGAAAALVAAVERPRVKAVVSRAGRPDLAMAALAHVRAPTLLVVGGAEEAALRWNRAALARLGGTKRLVVVPGAAHLFDEPGAIERVADLTVGWFAVHLLRATAAEISRVGAAAPVR